MWFPIPPLLLAQGILTVNFASLSQNSTLSLIIFDRIPTLHRCISLIFNVRILCVYKKTLNVRVLWVGSKGCARFLSCLMPPPPPPLQESHWLVQKELCRKCGINSLLNSTIVHNKQCSISQTNLKSWDSKLMFHCC